MSGEKNQLQIIVDKSKVRFLVGFGYSGKIDRRQGKPKQFGDPLLAFDHAEALAKTHNMVALHYSPNEDRSVIKVHGTPELWAAIKAEKTRLDALNVVAQND